VAGTAVAAGMAAVAGTAVADGVAAVFEADTTDAATAVAGTGMLATIDGTAAGAGGAAVTTRGGYSRFHGLTRITVITDQVTGMGMAQDTDTGMDRVTATDTDSGSVILRPLFSGRIG
jgi:hypothetical protein